MVFRHNILQLPEGCEHTHRDTHIHAHRYPENGRLLCRLVEAKSFRSQLIFPVNCTDDNKSKRKREREREKWKEWRRRRLSGKVAKKAEGEIKCKQRSVRGMRVCISVCVRVCVVFCLPCLIMRLHAHKGKSQTGDTPNQTSHGRNRRGTRRATSCYAVGQPFFMIIIFIFYLFTCAFDRVDSRCLPCLSTYVCVCVCA